MDLRIPALESSVVGDWGGGRSTLTVFLHYYTTALVLVLYLVVCSCFEEPFQRFYQVVMGFFQLVSLPW